MLSWESLFRLREFWGPYCASQLSVPDEAQNDEDVGGDAEDDEGAEEEDGDSDDPNAALVNRLFGVSNEPYDNNAATGDLYNFDGRRIQTALRLLAGADNDPRKLVEKHHATESDDSRASMVAHYERALADKDKLRGNAVIRLPFASGYVWNIEFSPEPGVYHSLTCPNSRKLVLGRDDPHFALPILRWTEVTGLCAALERNWTGDFGFEYVPLLFGPAAWLSPEDDAGMTRARVRDSWKRVGLIGDTEVEDLVAHLQVRDVRWRRDPELGFVNDGEYSYRNPKSFWGKKWIEEGAGGYEAFAHFMRDSLPGEAPR